MWKVENLVSPAPLCQCDYNEYVLFGGRGMDCLCFAFSSSLEATETEHVEPDVKLEWMGVVGKMNTKWELRKVFNARVS